MHFICYLPEDIIVYGWSNKNQLYFFTRKVASWDVITRTFFLKPNNS